MHVMLDSGPKKGFHWTTPIPPIGSIFAWGAALKIDLEDADHADKTRIDADESQKQKNVLCLSALQSIRVLRVPIFIGIGGPLPVAPAFDVRHSLERGLNPTANIVRTEGPTSGAGSAPRVSSTHSSRPK